MMLTDSKKVFKNHVEHDEVFTYSSDYSILILSTDIQSIDQELSYGQENTFCLIYIHTMLSIECEVEFKEFCSTPHAFILTCLILMIFLYKYFQDTTIYSCQFFT